MYMATIWQKDRSITLSVYMQAQLKREGKEGAAQSVELQAQNEALQHQAQAAQKVSWFQLA